VKRLLSFLALSTLAAAALVVPVAPTGAGVADASVYVIHGIPNVPVDVCVGDSETPLIANFEPGTSAGPVALASGDYLLKLANPGYICADSETIYSETVTVPPGSSTIVAWAPDGVDLAVFPNDTSCTEVGTGRVTARHAAASPGPVDLLVNGAVVVAGLQPGTQEVLDVPVGTYTVGVNLAGSQIPVIPPADVTVVEGVNLTLTVIDSGEVEQDEASVVAIAIETGVCTIPVAPVEPTFTG
jgi:hypothetical protein